MKQDATKLVAVCGLYCGTRPSYLAFLNCVRELGIPIAPIHMIALRREQDNRLYFQIQQSALTGNGWSTLVQVSTTSGGSVISC